MTRSREAFHGIVLPVTVQRLVLRPWALLPAAVLVLLAPLWLTAASGAAVDSFGWLNAPTNVLAGVPFPGSIQARDASGMLVSSFSGTVDLSAVLPGIAPRLLITEVSAPSPRAVEFGNPANTPVAVGGWKAVFYDSAFWPEPTTTFVFPPGTVIPPGGVVQVAAGGTAPGRFPSFSLGLSLNWLSHVPDNPIAILLRDDTGAIVDFFGACGGHPVLITAPASIPPAEWQGLPAPLNPVSTITYQRVGGLDHNNAADWITTNATLGTWNAGLRPPFAAPNRTFPVHPASVQLDQGQWTGLLTLTQPARGVRLRADNGAGLAGDSGTLDVIAGPSLTLVLPAGGSESSAGVAGAGEVFVEVAPATNVTVTLALSAGGEFALPAQVILNAGQTNVVFAVTNLDDALLDGVRVIGVTALAAGFASGTATMTNADDELSQLSLTLPANAREGDAPLLGGGRVSVAQPVALDYPVALSSSDTNEVQVPAGVFIPAGQTSALFNVIIVNDSYLDGPRAALVEARAPDGATAGTSLTVADNESPNMVLELYYPVEEGRGVVSNAVRITLGALTTTNLTVTLTSLNPARLQLPATIVIPAGQAAVETYFVVPDDGLTNGLEIVQGNASAPGYPEASNTTNIRDNDTQRFFFPSIPVAQTSGVPFVVTIYAHTIDGYVPSTYSGQVGLSAIGHAGPLSVTPSSITFTNGIWGGRVTVTGEARGVRLVADDGLGHTGMSNPVDVPRFTSTNMPVSDLVFDASRNQILAGVMAGGSTPSNRVVALDPATGGIVWSLPLSAAPGRMALSDDFSFLYVGDNTAGGVIRVDLNARAITLRITLGSDAQFGSYYVEDMEVMPGNRRSIVVSRRVNFGAYNQGMAVYDDGQQRPVVLPQGPVAYGYFVGFYGNAGKLYSATPDGMRSVEVGPGGLVSVDFRGDPIYRTDFEPAGGLLYGTSGRVFWPETLRVAGLFPAAGYVRPDPATGRIVFIEGNRLRCFDLNTYADLGSITLSVAPSSPPALIRCGEDRLAFRLADNRLAFVRTDLIPVPAATDLSVHQSGPVSPLVGSNATYFVTVSNAGPVSATNVVLADLLPEMATFVSAFPSQGSCSHTNGIVNCPLGGLGSNGVATVAVTVWVRSPGRLVNVTRVIGGALAPANDVITLTSTAVFGPVLPGLTEIAIRAQDLAYDVASNRLWAAVTVNESRTENSLRGIALGSVTNPPPLLLGDGPSRLAASADGRFLYVAVSNGASVRRLDLWNASPTIQFPVGHILDMKVVPDTPTALALFRGPLSILDNGVARPSVVDSGCTAFDFGNGALPIVAMGNAFTRDLFVINLTAGGVQAVSTNALLFGPAGGAIRFVNNRIFSASGDVVDAVGKTRLASLPISGLLEVDPAGRAYYLVQRSGPAWALVAYDASTLAWLWGTPIDGVAGFARSLVRCGPGLLAFYSDGGQIFLLNTAELPHQTEPDLNLSFLPPVSESSVNAPLTAVGYVRNDGLMPAMAVTVTNTFPEGTVIVSFSTAHGACSNVAGQLVCSLGHLGPGGAASYIVTLAKTNAGTLAFTAQAASNLPDAVPTNNVATFTAVIHPAPVADVSVQESFVVGAGTRVSYQLVISNAGPDTAEGVTLTDVYPDLATLLSLQASQGTTGTGFGHITANLGSIPAHAAAVVTFEVQAPLSALWINRATVASATSDWWGGNNDTVSATTPEGTALLTHLPVPMEEWTYDDSHRRLYIKVPSASPWSNSVVAVDPDSSAVTPILSLGEPTGRIAVSSDGAHLYVASLVPGRGVLRVNPLTGVPEESIVLPDDPVLGVRTPTHLATMPGQPNVLAISTRAGIEIYDGVSVRPVAARYDAGSVGPPMAFLDPPDRLFVHAAEGSRVMSVDAAGVTLTTAASTGVPAGPFSVEAGVAFFDSGHLWDIGGASLVWRLPVGPGFVAPDVTANRICFAPSTGNLTVRTYQIPTFIEMGSFLVPGFGPPAGLLRLRSGEFALRTAGSPSRLLITRPAPLDLPRADMALTGTSTSTPLNPGTYFTCNLSVQNKGPWGTTNVVVSNSMPAGISFASATSSRGSCVENDGLILCSVGNLTNGQSANLVFTFIANAVGIISNRIHVLHGRADPNPLNDTVLLTNVVNPAPALSIADAGVLEGSNLTSISFRVTLSAASSATVGANFLTVGGTAIPGQDYVSTTGLISFSPGVTTRTLTLSSRILGNTTVGTNRYFFVRLVGPSNVTLARSQATAYIIEDDFYTLRVQGTNVLEGDSGRRDAVFSFLLTPPASQTVTVDFATMDGLASGTADYVGRAGTLRFAPGLTNQVLTIPILGDLCQEPDEPFYLQLSAPVNALTAVNEARGLIVNDDPTLPLRIVSLSPAQPGWRIRLTTTCDKIYRLQRSETLLAGSWIDVADPVVGSGREVSVTDSNPSSAGQVFYRVRVVP
jgi:uncharacterized repeat protein (TIGR01451 family)